MAPACYCSHEAIEEESCIVGRTLSIIFQDHQGKPAHIDAVLAYESCRKGSQDCGTHHRLHCALGSPRYHPRYRPVNQNSFASGLENQRLQTYFCLSRSVCVHSALQASEVKQSQEKFEDGEQREY